ncbi:MAG: hypothetical protein ACRC56_10820 [Bosea sp. (in: a-proteobacteria)]
MSKKYLILLGLGLTSAFSTGALSQSACQKLDGEWAGTMSGAFQGPVSMSLSNCSVTWKLPDERMNYCNFSSSAGGMEYSCSRGSRGSVVVQGNKITMRNIHTGNNYTVVVTKR